MKSHRFKLYRAHSISFISSNVNNFFWSWILKSVTKFRKRNRKWLFFVHVLQKTRIPAFSRRSRALTAKKCTEKRDARAKLLFCQSKPIAFLPFSLRSTSSLLFITEPRSLHFRLQSHSASRPRDQQKRRALGARMPSLLVVCASLLNFYL